MNHSAVVKTYSDETLAGIVRQLSISRDWPARLAAAQAEKQRRRNKRR